MTTASTPVVGSAVASIPADSPAPHVASTALVSTVQPDPDADADAAGVAWRGELGMSHLGRWLSAQVDGELDGVERDRVLNHLAGCDACREEANALRVLKRRMTALGDSAAETRLSPAA